MRSRSAALSTWPAVQSTERTVRSRSVADVRDTPESDTSRPVGSSIGAPGAPAAGAACIVLMFSTRVQHCSTGRAAFIRSYRVLAAVAACDWPSGFWTIDSCAPS